MYREGLEDDGLGKPEIDEKVSKLRSRLMEEAERAEPSTKSEEQPKSKTRWVAVLMVGVPRVEGSSKVTVTTPFPPKISFTSTVFGCFVVVKLRSFFGSGNGKQET